MKAVKENCGFGEAIEAVKNGYMIGREGWNGKGLFVFAQVPAMIDKEVVAKMQSLPQSVKNEFKSRFVGLGKRQHITYSNQLALVKPSNDINGWSPSTSDAMANDWIIYNA